MFALFDPQLVTAITRWETLKRWERRELGQNLRRLGFSYREIERLIPVGKGTLSAWCRDLHLTPLETQLLAQRQIELVRQGQVGRRRRYGTRDLIAERRSKARAEVDALRDDPFWVAGVMSYWAEGSKTSRRVAFANSDPAMVKLFIAWALRYLDLTPDRFTVLLYLHTGQDEDERRRFWSGCTSLPLDRFRKTYFKPEGTGHRKNKLYNGTVQVRITKSSALLDRLLGWIEGLGAAFIESGYHSAGR